MALTTQQAAAFTSLQTANTPMPTGPAQFSASVNGLRHKVGALATELFGSGGSGGGKHKPGKGELSAQAGAQGRPAARKSDGSSAAVPGQHTSPPANLRQRELQRQGRVGSRALGQNAGKDATVVTGVPGTAPGGAEIGALRTATTSVFQNSDGTRTMRVYSRPVHFKKTDGSWANIDTSVVQGSDSRWRQQADDQGASFAATASDPSLVTWTLDAGHQVSYGLQGALPVAARVKGNTLTYPSALQSSDVVYNALATSIKETLELHDASAPTTWTFPLRLTGLTASLGASGNVAFTDSTGKVDLIIPRGFMEDSAKQGASGQGAISGGVTYSLTQVNNAPALVMKLDVSWLHDAHRIFPIRVDPTSSSNANAASSTFVETPYNINFSTDPSLKVGTYDSGTHQATSYMQFPSIGTSSLQNQYIEKVTLNVDAIDGSQCNTATEVDVRQIVGSWNPSSATVSSDVPLGAKLGQDSFLESNQNGCTSGAVWIPFDLGDNATAAGTKLVQSWVHGGSNYGLALTADISDTNAWKVFDSTSTSYPPYLAVTYSTYGADYATPTSYIPPTSAATGSQSVTLTNTGSVTWTHTNMALKARLYDSNWNEQSTTAPLTYVPSSVAPNGSVTMTGTIPAVAPGKSYQLCWDLYVNGTGSLESTYGVPFQNCTWISAANIAPQIDGMQPLSNTVVNALSPELHADGHDPDNWPGTGLTYDFQLYSPTGTTLATSGWTSSPSWVVPQGLVAWNGSYSWNVAVSDSKLTSAWSNPAVFTTQVPQPPITSHLATADDGSGHAFDPQIGNYSTSATDTRVKVAGPSLGITRSYNSLDPRSSTLFGAGWSSLYDMKVQPDGDSSGGVVLTGADGRTERFGRNDFALTQATSVGDVTGDGVDDVVAVDNTTGDLYLYRGPDYSAATRLGISHGNWSSGPTGNWSTLTWLTGGNVDGDTIGDLIAVDPSTGKLWEWNSTSLNCPTNVHTAIITGDPKSAAPFPPNAPFSCAPVQIGSATDWRTMSNLAITPALSGDGKKDLVAVENSTGLMYAYPVNTDGTLGTRVEIGTGWGSMTQVIGGNFTQSTTGVGSIIAIAPNGDLDLYKGTGTGTLGTSVTTGPTVLGKVWTTMKGLSQVNGIAGDTGSDFLATDTATGIQYLYHAASGYQNTGRTTTAMHLYTSPSGESQVLLHQADGSWAVRDKSGTGYTFAQHTSDTAPWQLTKITDKNGRTQTLAYNTDGTLASVTDTASGRTLHATWNTAKTHITSVFTDPVVGTDQNTDLTWTYTYSSTFPDELDQVCAPPTGTNTARSCTGYSYTSGAASGSHFRTAVLDSSPSSYWRLGDAQGTAATSEVTANEGADNATYTGVALGTTAGPLSGSPTNAANFNGTSSRVELPSGALKNSYTAVGLWFKTSTAGILLSYQNQAFGSKTAPSHPSPVLYVGADLRLRGELYGPAVGPSPITTASTVAVADNQWHFVVLSAAGNTQTMYLDGKSVGTDIGAVDHLDQNTTTIGAGYRNSGWPSPPAAAGDGNNYFKGQIAEVATYSHALGAQAVAQQWQSGHVAATELQAITQPSKTKTTLTASYDAVADRASKLTDAHGGTWTLHTPTVSGSTQQYKGAVLGSRPSGYWRLSDSAGTQATNQVYYSRQTPDNGTYTNVSPSAAGGPPTGYNGSASFDGSTSSLQLPTANAPQQGPAAIALWFNTTKPGVLFDYQSIPVGAAHTTTDQWDPALYIGTDNKLHGKLFTGGTALVSTATVTDGTWHFVVLDATSTSSQTLYLDGAAAAAAPLTGTIIPTGGQYVYVGAGTADGWPAAPTDPDGHFTGQIADVATFPHGLTATQIANLNTTGTTTSTCTGSVCQRINNQPAYDAAIVDAEPSGYWPLADTAGNQAAEVLSSAAKTQNQGSYHGTTSGAVGPWATGSTTATTFDGTSSYVQLPGTVAVKAAPASVEVWFKTTTAGVLYSYQSIPLGGTASSTDFWDPALYVDTNGYLRGEFFTGGASSTTISDTTVADGKWHQAALVASSTSQQLYLDGHTTGAPINAAVQYGGQGYAYLGAGTDSGSWPYHPASASGYFNGAMADFASYGYALSAATIAGDYQIATTASTGTGMDADTAYRDHIVQDGPIDYWRLDDPQSQWATVAQDELGTALPDPYAGTYSNVTLNTAGPSGNSDESAATFNGTSSYVALPTSASPTTAPASVELWFKTTTAGVLYSYQSIPLSTAHTSSDSWDPALYVGTDGKLHGEFYTAGASTIAVSATAVTDGKWHQAVLAATSTSQQLYLDGAPSGAAITGTAQYGGQGHTYLGAGTVSSGWTNSPTGDANSTSYFTGSLAEAAYYPSTLDAASVAAHYQAMGSSANPTPVTTTTVTDPGGNTLTYKYDTGNGGRAIARTDAYGNTTSYSYDTAGFLNTVTDADGHTTTYGHDARGNTVSTTTCRSAASCQTSYATYALNPTNALDPTNDQVSSTSDARSSSSTDLSYATSYRYDAAGDLTTITRPDRSTSSNTYTLGTETATGGGTEPPGLLAQATDYMGHATTYAYYSNGDLASSTNPAGLATSFAHDNLGRTLTQTVTCSNCATGLTNETTSYTWDGQGNALTQTDPTTTDAVNGALQHTRQTSYTYDVDGNQTGQTVTDLQGNDKPRSTSWAYNANNLVSSTTDPAGRTTSFGYDAFGNTTSKTDPAGTQFVYSYSPMGQLQQTAIGNYTGSPTSPVSARWQVVDSRAYDPAGRLATDTDAMGRTTHTYYFDDNRVAEVDLDTFHNFDATSKTYDGTTRTVVEKTETYDAAGNVIEQTTGGGKTTVDSTFDSLNRVTTSTVDPAGLARTTSYTYDGDNHVLATKLSSGTQATRETDHTYDNLGDTVTTTVVNTPANSVTSFTYNELGQNTSMTTPNGNVSGVTAAAFTFQFGYDALGQQTQVIAPPVTTTSFSTGTGQAVTATASTVSSTGYNTFGEAAETEDGNGSITTVTHTFDSAGEHQAVASSSYTAPGTTTPSTSVTQTDYDTMGRASTVTVDPSGLDRVTTHIYDQLGHEVETDLPAVGGTVPKWLHSYDLAGETLSVTDPTGAVSQSTYDDLGRNITLSQVVRQTSHTSTTAAAAIYTGGFGYDDAGNRTTVVTPNGENASSTYDAAGEQSTTTDPLGRTTSTAYDLAGDVVTVTLPGTDTTHPGASTTTRYDPAGNQTGTSVVDTSGKTVSSTSAQYDANGNALSTTDADGNTSTAAYNGVDQLTQQVQPTDTVAAHNITTSYGYDSNGNQTAYTDGNGNKTYTTYNSLGLKESVIDPATSAYPNLADRSYTTSYDTAGEATTIAEPGGITKTGTYDAAGRLTSQTGTGAEAATTSRTLGYDADGRLTSLSTPTGTQSYTYEDRGQLWTSSGPAGTASYTYNSDGKRTSLTNSNGTTAYTYDSAGQLAILSDPLTNTTLTYSYYPTGDLKTVNYGTGGPSQSYTYNAQRNLTGNTLATSTGATVASQTYGYTSAGRVNSTNTTGMVGATTNTYSYDKAGRISSWVGGTSTTNYGYDANGNLTTRGSATATYNARNQLATSGTTSYSYTARGTLASTTIGGTATMASTYNAFDQLATQGAQRYTYDALGRLASSNGHTFTYDGTSDATTSDGTESYTRTADGSLTSISASGTAAFSYSDPHGDLLGTFTGGGTTLAGSTSYDPWGQPVASTGTSHDLGYQGGWTDSTTGQVNTASRWYSPNTANFTSRDTAALNPSTSASGNLYAYANDNPLTNADPSGQSACVPGYFSMSGGGGGGGSGAGHGADPYAPMDWSNKMSAMERYDAMQNEYSYGYVGQYSSVVSDTSVASSQGGGHGWMWWVGGGVAVGGLWISDFFAGGTETPVDVAATEYWLAAGSSSCTTVGPPPPPPIDWHKKQPKPCIASQDKCNSTGQNGNLNVLEAGHTHQGNSKRPTTGQTSGFNPQGLPVPKGMNLAEWATAVEQCEWDTGMPQAQCKSIPMFVVDGKVTPKIAINDLSAIEAGYPSLLHALRNTALADINRKFAGCGTQLWKNIGGNQSCDEYPFASTFEGGLGAQTMGVPIGEQNRQAITLSAFLSRNRIRMGDPYFVAVINVRIVNGIYVAG